MLSWDIENHDSQTSFYCILAMKEYDGMSTNKSLYCYNVSIDDVSSSASVTVLTELQPYTGIGTVIETSVTHHSPPDIPITLVGKTVFRTGKVNTCKLQDRCPPGSEIKVVYGRTECAGDMGRTRVNVSVPGVNFRTIQLVVQSRLTTCQGIMRHCVYVVEKRYGGRFRLEISLILADNNVCKYSKIIPSQICGDPGDPPNSTSLLTSPAADKKTSYLPTYAYILLALACSGVFAVLMTISCFIFQRLRRDGCPRRGRNRSFNNQNTLDIEENDERYTETERAPQHRQDYRLYTRHLTEETTFGKLPFRDSTDEDDIT